MELEEAYEKATRLLEAGIALSEFGTRRRRLYQIQDLVVETLLRAQREHPQFKGKMNGTSNVCVLIFAAPSDRRST